ncbi:MAG: HAMP domain-containing sensor histidine kinase [Chloroflexota bacterium]
MSVIELFALALLVALVVLLFQWRKQIRLLNERDLEVAALRQELASTQMRLQVLRMSTVVLADTAFDAILVIDHDRRISIINQTAKKLFGVHDGNMDQTLMSVTRSHELEAMVEAARRSEPVLESQIEIKERPFRVRSGAINLAGQVSIVLALQDISELLRLTRARREMVANFSHDLRTPISSIRLLVDTLTQNFGRSAERDLKLLRRIGGETDSLQHMTQELIDLSMIESGQAIIRMVPVNFHDILVQALDIMGTQLEQKKLDVLNEIPDSLPVLIDPEQTRRVLTNLLHNAVKFTPSKGKISFKADCKDNAEQFVTICVKDTGPGIPPQDRTRVFERFYQVDTARSANPGKVSGSGLGLSIAKHIIEAQGGTIWAEAGVPNGACICFTIPLADKQISQTVPQTNSQ